jgi:hypothetical protein
LAFFDGIWSFLIGKMQKSAKNSVLGAISRHIPESGWRFLAHLGGDTFLG